MSEEVRTRPASPPVPLPISTPNPRCDLCRARKVKCGGERPVCTQCTKSAARGGGEVNCVYEGGASARAGGKKRASNTTTTATSGAADDSVNEPAAGFGGALPSAPDTNGHKRSRDGDSDDDDQDEDDTPDITVNGNGRTKKRSGNAAGVRVETLVERITELERRLRLQSQPVPASVHVHARPSASPPFYPAPYLPTPGSAPMEARRSTGGYSVGGVEPSVKDIAAAWTPESSVRFTPLGSEPPPAARTGYTAPAYASFIPPLPHLREFNETTDPTLGADFSGTSNGGFRQTVPAFSGSSYPPLNYSAGLGLNGSGTERTPTYAQGTSPNEYLCGDAAVAAAAAAQPTDVFDTGFISSTDNSLAPSPEDNFSLDASLLQILYPSWPSSLPLPTTVNHHVSVFFSRAKVPAAMFNHGKFMASLDLAPTDKAFPHTALLHAILAYSCNWMSEDALKKSDELGRMKYWESEKSPRDYHWKEARKEVNKGLSGGGNLFQVLQATLLLCYQAYFNADFTDLWMLTGIATRLCTPLGLNHLPPWSFEDNKAGTAPPDWREMMQKASGVADGRKTALLPPPETLEDHYERVTTFWVAFSIDRHVSASTDWSTSIDELDVTTPLPVMSISTPAAFNLRNEKFMQTHSPELGSQGLFFKAVILLGRVVNFLQRLPYHSTLKLGESCQSYRARLKKLPEFTELDFDLGKFRALTSADFFKSGGTIDSHLASAYAIPHAASILLHEPFTERWDKSATSSLARCLMSAKCVVNSTYVLYSSSSDLSGLDPFIGWCWTVVGRSLVRDYAVKRLWGDLDSASFSLMLAQHCLSFTTRCSQSGKPIPILAAMAATMQGFLDNPDALLPFEGGEDTNPPVINGNGTQA
ncbi:C6 transcription factor [Pseudohyphozyma bogoriensis]|nr:C6 transcription factor [Pseudohyphozyma bogoriensis]